MRFLLSILCVLLSFGAMAITTRDSIGVENQNGNQLIIHKVARKESYYSIGRLYNVNPKAIIAINHNVPLQIGLIIKVPTDRPFAQSPKPVQSNNTNTLDGGIIEYKVGPKEYLYSIAKRFNTTVDEIKKLNNLRGNNLSIGQVIKVRQGQNETVQTVNTQPQIITKSQPAAPVINTPPAVPSETTETPVAEKPKIPMGRLGVSELSEKGVAIWISDKNLDGTKMLALHRTAPIGTVIKITNPMTERVTFAKVVGKFTENESTKDAIIVVTKATAELLGALDKRFQVTLDYGMPNEHAE